MNKLIKKRLDILLFEKGLVTSRKIASDLIKEGKVIVNGEKIIKPSKEIIEDANIEVTEVPKFVSRAGLKLEGALKKFGLSVAGEVVLDVGSSTGGFTDCLLQNGVKKVYAIDVGTDQLSDKIRKDNRVVSMEKTDIRNIRELPEKADLAVIDVSFISLDKVLPVTVKFLTDKAEIITLVKPQFEVGKENLGKGGIVKDPELQNAVIEKTKNLAQTLNLKIVGEMESPIKGGDGNNEYLLHLKK